ARPWKGRTAKRYHVSRCCSGGGMSDRSVQAPGIRRIREARLFHREVDGSCPISMNVWTGPRVVRTIGRAGFTALVVNCIIGSSIFGMPGEVYRELGAASPLAMIGGGLCMAIFIACAAEVGSQFSQAGGPYLYTRRTFGRFAGLLVAWFLMLVG